MVGRRLFVNLLFALILALFGSTARAQSYNALEACMALSTQVDDIHLCMDDYLNQIDGSMGRITELLANSLSSDLLAGFDASQQAFEGYRRINCLWYLDFSSPREEAEQISKNCFAIMSQQRLRELQTLISPMNRIESVLRGFYVYGAERNSFQLCGSDDRYWLEGDNTLLGQIQQLYQSIASNDLQLLYAEFVGEVDDEVDDEEQVPAGHKGVARLQRMMSLRVPTESDCRLPEKVEQASEELPTPEVRVSTVSDLPVGDQPVTAEDPEEQLMAYFGEWLVDCTAVQARRECRLDVALEGEEDMPAALLSITRHQKKVTSMEVFLADREVDSPARIRWAVDAVTFGDIVGSEIRVDEAGTRQLVPTSRFMGDFLLPVMTEGVEIELEVLASVDDSKGEPYEGSLMGLTKALAFSDDFIRNGGS